MGAAEKFADAMRGNMVLILHRVALLTSHQQRELMTQHFLGAMCKKAARLLCFESFRPIVISFDSNSQDEEPRSLASNSEGFEVSPVRLQVSPAV